MHSTFLYFIYLLGLFIYFKNCILIQKSQVILILAEMEK